MSCSSSLLPWRCPWQPVQEVPEAAEARANLPKTTAAAEKPAQATGEKIVNVGVTGTVNTLNPLLMDGVEIDEYATGLMFLPLVELDTEYGV